MSNLSVVIISKNAEAHIKEVINSAFLVSQEVIVVDSGSTDQTLTIASQLQAKILHISWNGYGDARNKGAAYASNGFILNLDADEVITNDLAENINRLDLKKDTVYGFNRLNFLGLKEIRFGEWSGDVVYRCYHKNATSWNLNEVHENLELNGLNKKIVKGNLHHYTTPDIQSYQIKLDHYALLSAKKYFTKGKQADFKKRAISPVFSFVKNYILKLGFLDGANGWKIALAHYQYNKKKYRYLQQLTKNPTTGNK